MNNNWKSYELGNIVSIYNGSTPSTTNEEFWNGDIIWVTPRDLSDQNQKYISEGKRKITRKALSKNKLLPKGTILLSSRAPIGLLSISLTELVTNQGFKNIVVDEKLLNNEFLYYNLKLRKNELNNLGTGTTFKELSKSTLEKFKINLPDLPTQKSIAKVLSDLDAKIELNNKINRELEAMAKTLYDYWFVQFDFPDANSKPYKSSGGKMVYNAELKREIPEGWEVKSIEKFIEVKDGTHDSPKPTSTGYHLITSKNLLESGLDFENANLISEKDYININKRSQVVTGDILFSMIGSIGVLYKVEESNINFAIKNVALYKSSQEFEFRNYILQYLKSYDMKRYMGNVIAGSIQKFIGLGSLRKMPFLFNRNVIDEYNSKTKALYKSLDNNKRQNQHLIALRDWLLPMLMNGQVTVKEAEEKLSMAAEPSVKYGN